MNAEQQNRQQFEDSRDKISMNQGLLNLLKDIKTFLSVRLEEKGVFNLLARLDQEIQIFSPSFLSQTLIQSSQQSIQETLDDFQVLSHQEAQNSEEEVELVDIFVMDFSFPSGKYEIKPILEQGTRFGESEQMIDSHRHAILSLTLGPTKTHCSLKQKTNSMTELHQLISNIPISSPPLILPSYINRKSKYTYIYESKQCICYLGAYYLVERFYCVVTNGFAGQKINQLVKKLKEKVFINRMLNSEDPNDVEYNNVDEIFQKTCPQLRNQLQYFKFQPSKIEESMIIQRQITFQSFEVQRIKTCRLITYILFSCLNQFKVVLVTSKEKRNILSQIILSLQIALCPLKYLYPIALCTISDDHCQLLESPVPLFIGTWGSQKKVHKFLKCLQKDYGLNDKLQKQSIPMGVFDLEKWCTIGYSRLTVEDCFIIEKMEKYLWKYGKGVNFCDKISNLLSMLLNEINEKKQYNEWMEALRSKIKKSQMYYVFIDQ